MTHAVPRHGEGRAALAAGILYFAALFAFYPYRNVFAFDPDEGYNAIKALLLHRGDALYAQIWSDQPPLFTYLLRFWFDLFGWQVNTGRALVLLFAAAAMFAVYDSARLASGHLAGIVAGGALAASAYFPRLSVSLMLGVPALALVALAAWAALRWANGGRRAWLLGSGALFGCSLAIKLSALFLAPVIAIWLALASARHRALGPVCQWIAAALASTAVLLVVLAGPSHVRDFIDPHLLARGAPRLQHFGAAGLLLTGRAEWQLTLVALAACAFLLIRRRRASWLLFPLWVGGAVLALLAHAPIWYHHQLLLTVAYCPAIGIALAEIAREAAAGIGPPRWWRPAILILAGVLLASSALTVHGRPPPLLSGARQEALDAMRHFAADTHVVLATDPMYAFRAGFAVPPALAVLSAKRVLADPRLAGEIRAAFAAAPPAQVVLAAEALPRLTDALREAMGNHYRVAYADTGRGLVTVYVRADLLTAARRQD